MLRSRGENPCLALVLVTAASVHGWRAAPHACRAHAVIAAAPAPRLAAPPPPPPPKVKGSGYYVRPSAALERGGGFYVPGLEGDRLRLLVAVVLLVGCDKGTPSTPTSMIDGLRESMVEDKPVLFWDTIPATWQQDVDGLVHEFGRKVPLGKEAPKKPSFRERRLRRLSHTPCRSWRAGCRCGREERGPTALGALGRTKSR